MILRVSKQFSFESAHFLPEYNGKCKNLHGHSYKLTITILGKNDTDNTGMVMDFGDLKKIVQEEVIAPFDHALILKEDSKNEFAAHKRFFLGKTPTAENIVCYIKEAIFSKLPPHITLINIKLHETETSYCEWNQHDQ